MRVLRFSFRSFKEVVLYLSSSLSPSSSFIGSGTFLMRAFLYNSNCKENIWSRLVICTILHFKLTIKSSCQAWKLPWIKRIVARGVQVQSLRQKWRWERACPLLLGNYHHNLSYLVDYSLANGKKIRLQRDQITILQAKF